MSKGRRNLAFLLAMAGCGGMLFDFGGTIINPALPYLESLGTYTTAELSHLTSAVVMSAAFAGLVAGTLAERFGRKRIMLVAAMIAALACVPICLLDGYAPFYCGRILQGVAAGLIGVVVPMYLAESLEAEHRGKGAGVFQFMDVVGILFCSIVGVVAVRAFGGPNDPAVTAAAKSAAWRAVFWSSAIPALVFFFGALGLDESPVWLEKVEKRKGGEVEKWKGGEVEKWKGGEVEKWKGGEVEKWKGGEVEKRKQASQTIFQRRYIVPFVLSVAILACNQATGCNAIQYFALKMFMDAGLGDVVANYANVALWVVMLTMTAVGCLLVDRRGRKFLLNIGTLGMALADLGAGFVFLAIARGWMAPSLLSGWLAVAGVALFIAAFSVGPGVVVWLALSELLPDRIRANGMAIGLFVNMMVAYLISDLFLQLVEKWGYAPVLFLLGGFAVVYFVIAACFLPETKGKTLAEIEAGFAKRS